MAGKEYSIKFNGLKESVSDTETLIDMLKKLKEATDNLTKEQLNLIKEQQKATKTSDELYQQFFSSYVDVAIGERPGLRKKPEPDMVEEALKQLDSNLEDTVYVGDSNVDLLTARNSHLPCISVLWGFRTHQELLAAGADQFIEKPQEILAYSNNK